MILCGSSVGAVNFCRLQGFFKREWGQDHRHAFGEHRLARAGGPIIRILWPPAQERVAIGFDRSDPITRVQKMDYVEQ